MEQWKKKRNDFRQAARRKLKCRSGETIGEVLVALLISSLALVMLASMIQTALNLVTKSEAKMKTYYEANVELEKPTTSSTVTIVPTGSGSGANITENVTYGINKTFSKPVVAYAYEATSEEPDGISGGGNA